VRILSVYHAGRDPAHRLRERALVAQGMDVTLVVPSHWPDAGAQPTLTDEPFPIVELDVRRPGDVNRHLHDNDRAVRSLLAEIRPDVLDLHEEPVGLVTRQWLRAAPVGLPVVLYTAQNIDKRFPPPFAHYETQALRRARALYPCSRQAASVARGKGFDGQIEVLPLGFDPAAFRPGLQSLEDPVITLGLVGRLVPEKGVRDAVHVLAAVRQRRLARLLLVGSGPEVEPALALAAELDVAADVEVLPWAGVAELGHLYSRMHVLLVPSRATRTWVEQFGRVIVEAQASGAVVAGYSSGSIPEVAGEAGLLVPESDVAALAEAASDLITQPTDFDRRRAEGLSLSGARTWPHVASGLADLYAAAAGTPPPAAPTGRAAAQEEFGEPARISGGGRPFALPVLRQDQAVSDILGRTIDSIAERRRTRR
jgi:glycosyltransferase involved in cell wall biosynthesis